MSGFYEWKKSTGTPYLIQPVEDTLFWAACLYDTWIDKLTGEMRKSFTILTMPPNGFMQSIHDRMPVLLDPKAGGVERWLELSNRNPAELIRQFPSHRMKKYRVSVAVGDVRNNFEGLLREIPEDPELF